MIATLSTVTKREAQSYLAAANGNELLAACELARDRNRLDGDPREPDDAHVHHALYLLRRARGESAPSFDAMRVALKALRAAPPPAAESGTSLRAATSSVQRAA